MDWKERYGRRVAAEKKKDISVRSCVGILYAGQISGSRNVASKILPKKTKGQVRNPEVALLRVLC